MIIDTPKKSYDIVIVGAGPVGLALAALLDKQQVQQTKSEWAFNILLVDGGPVIPSAQILDVKKDDDKKNKFEKYTDTLAVYDSQVFALSQASKNLFEHLGLWRSGLSEQVCQFDQMHICDAKGTGTVQFSAAEAAMDALGWIAEKKRLRRSLLQYLSKSEYVDVLGDAYVDVASLSNDTSRQSLKISNCNKQDKKFSQLDVSAKLTVAADGSCSKIAAAFNFNFTEWSYEQTAVYATLRCKNSHQFVASQIFTSSGPVALLPLKGTGNYVSLVWSIDNAVVDQLKGLDDKAFIDELNKTLAPMKYKGKATLITDVSTRHYVPLTQRYAKKYIRNACAVVGDAAHSIHPLAGQGMNLGLADAQVLADEIAKHKALDESALASLALQYQKRRAPHNLAAMSAVEMFKRVFSSQNALIGWLRNTGMNAVNGKTVIKRYLAKVAAG